MEHQADRVSSSSLYAVSSLLAIKPMTVVSTANCMMVLLHERFLCQDQSLEALLFLQDVSKRMSLPMDIRLPPEFLKKLQMENENSPLCKPLSRMSRRASLVSDVSVFAMFVCLFNRTFSF